MAHEPRLGYQKRQEKIEGQGSRCQQKSLTTIAVEEEATGNNWPTPRSRDWKGEGNAVERQDGRHRLDTLEAVVRFGPHDPANPNTNGNSPDLWGTPTVRNPDRKESTLAKCQKFRESKGKKTVPKYLQEQVKDADNWATPRADKLGAENPESWAARNKAGKVHQMPLPTQVKANADSWPTPMSSGGSGGPHGLDGGHGVRRKIPAAMKGGILSPNWVEQLMGLPVGWTQVGTASTASAHSGTDASPRPSLSPSEPFTTN